MINYLTKKEVSEESLKVLDELKNERLVPLEDIKKLPEIQEANAYQDKVLSENRDELSKSLEDSIIKDMLDRGSVGTREDGKTLMDEQHNIIFTGEVKKNMRADIVIGLPASGKSSALVEPLSKEFKARVIDSDEIKKMLPGYNNGWGAGKVHEDSKRINRMVLAMSADRGDNIILPLVGSKPDKIISITERLKKLGYDVYLHYNELSLCKAIGRCFNRFLEEGRYLDLGLLYKYGDKVNDTYNELSQKEGLFNGYSKFSNDVTRGEKPRLIETNCRGKLWDAANDNSNRGDDKRLRGFDNRSTRYGDKDERREKTERKELKEIRAMGYKPNEKLLLCFSKIHKLNPNIGNMNLKKLNYLSKNGNEETKSYANSAMKELKCQKRNHDLERQ